MIHKLKIEKTYLQNLLSGRKKVEICLNDRDYQLGDFLEFADHDGLSPIYHQFIITHIHSGLGLQLNYVALSVEYMEAHND
jgi:hypothetical protein